jgi:hypothetical protein
MRKNRSVDFIRNLDVFVHQVHRDSFVIRHGLGCCKPYSAQPWRNLWADLYGRPARLKTGASVYLKFDGNFFLESFGQALDLPSEYRQVHTMGAGQSHRYLPQSFQ